MENEVDQLLRELREVREKMNFWAAVVFSWANFQVEDEEGSDQAGNYQAQMEYVAEMIGRYVEESLDFGVFKLSVEPERAAEEIRTSWPIVVRMAEEFGVDAPRMLEDTLHRKERGLAEARLLANLTQEPDEVYAQAIEQAAQGNFTEDFDKMFAGYYVVHVMHGDKPCRHPSPSLDEAILRTVHDYQSGLISAFLDVTRNGIVVLNEEGLSRRVNEILSAPLN